IHSNLPTKLQKLQYSSNIIDQYEICHFCQFESRIVPDGLSKNYPKNIRFDLLPNRINKFLSQLLEIVNKNRKSTFWDSALDVYNKAGHNGARKPTSVMARFQKFLPGYYGSKGASIILKTLISLFIDSKKLSSDMIIPLKPLDYLAEVLVPETAIRLIAEDQNIKLDEAKNVMEDSVDFGLYVHDVEDDDIEVLVNEIIPKSL
ncbi:8748_t:CDS:2, partial [Racocetra persica]